MKYRRFNSKSFSAIGDVLDTLVQKHRPNTNQAMVRIWELWEGTVGSDVAANARPVAFKGDLLLVHVSNSTWLHHLRYLEQDLIQKVNRSLEGDYIKRLKLKIGTI